MKTAIRMDDINPEMNYDKFNKVKSILDAAGLKPLIGVVPYNRDETLRYEKAHEDFPQLLQTLVREGWQVALHGYHHLYTTKEGGIFPLNHFSEFAGVDYDKQYMMIREGLEQLRNWEIDTKMFMAPGHSFDKNTLKAMKANNIVKITDGFGDKPYIRDGVTFYPISKKRSECISDKEGYSTYVIHADTMTDSDMEQFEKLISGNRDRFISYSSYMSVPATERRCPDNAKEYILATAKHILVSRKASKGTIIH